MELRCVILASGISNNNGRINFNPVDREMRRENFRRNILRHKIGHHHNHHHHRRRCRHHRRCRRRRRLQHHRMSMTTYVTET